MGLLVLCQFPVKSYAQDVYANAVTDSSLDFQRAYRAVDSSKTNYAYVSNLLTLLNTSYLRVRFPQAGKAGDVINVQLQGTGQVLGANLLSNVTVKLYDSLGNLVSTGSGGSLLQLNLLSSATNIYGIRYYTNPTDTFKFKEARVEFANVLTANILNEFRLYGVFYQRPCPPIVADSVYAYGPNALLTGYVNNPNNAIDANPNNVATMVVPLNLLGLLPPAYLDLKFPQAGNGGDFVGFTIGQASSLLNLSLLQNLEVKLYDLNGTLQETKTGFSLLNLRLLAGSTGKYSLGFVSRSGNYKIARARITLTGVLGVLQNLNVYNAYHYKINRPIVPVTSNGPTTFCQGGSVTLTANDTLGAQGYVWSTGATTQSITINQPGTYYVEVMDTVACSRRSIDIEVKVNPLPTPRIIGDSVLCAGTSGRLRLSQPFASYAWTGGSTADTLVVSQAATYTVNVVDSNGCAGSDNIVVQTNSLNITPTITATTCSNNSTGAISLAVTGGSGTYAYRWSTGATTSSVTTLKTGLYTNIITDNVYGCTYNRSFTVPATNTLSTKAATVNTSGCGKTDGKIDLGVVGGSGSYNYAWSNGATTAAVNNLAAGIYTVGITDAVSSCTVNDTIIISDAGNALTVTPTVVNATSCSSNNGSISLAVTGGSGSYTYKWSTGATTASITTLAAGTYYVSVKDNTSNCTYAGSVTVGNTATLTINGNITNATCNVKNGSIAASVTGGSSNYTYAWSNGATTATVANLQAGAYILNVNDNTTGCSAQRAFTVNDGGPAVTLNITQPACASNSNGAILITTAGTYTYKWSNGSVTRDQANLKPGQYTVTVTGATGCAANYTAVLAPKAQIELSASPRSNTACATAANGAVNVAISGGTTPYGYAWSNGATTKDITGLNIGTYNLSVTDAGGCTAAISVPVKTDSTKLLAVKVDTVLKASCNTAANGSINITATGGATPYTYAWSNSTTTRNLANVVPGTYTVTVKDALNCTVTATATITADTTNSIRITLDSTKSAGCAGSTTGAVYITPSRGVTPYTYMWSNSSTSQDLLNVAVGTYTVTVKDNNNCTAQLTANVPVNTGGGITAVIDSIRKSTCNVSMDAIVYARATGGVSPYSYSWSNGATTANLTNVNPGTYTLTARDANGCPGQVTAIVTSDTARNVKIDLDSVIGAGCNTGTSGAIYITASRGTAPYSYSWSNNANSADLINVVPNNYTVTVTDAKGCMAMRTAQIGIDPAKSLTANIDSMNGAGCVGSNSGNLYVTLTKGVTPYTYSWSNGAQTRNLIGVAPGTYTLTAGDAAGCFTTLNASVSVDTAKRIILEIDSVTGATCNVSNTGMIYLSVGGGKAPYAYAWSNGETVQDLKDATPGSYNVMVTDANGCTGMASAMVSVDTNRGVKVSTNTIDGAGCQASASGSISVNVTGGNTPYTYMWSNGTTTQGLTNVVPGSYTLTVTDAKGCAKQYNAIVGIDTTNSLKATVTTVVDARCVGSLSGSIDVDVTGGVSPYTYNWSNGATSQDLTYVASGNYALSVMDAVGCNAQVSVNVKVDNSNPIVLALDSVINVGCTDSSSGQIYVRTSGGVTPYTYLWSNGASTEDVINLVAGSYSVTATDNAGCKTSLSADVIKLANFVLDGIVKNITCYGLNNGSIDLTITNGGGNAYIYTWNTGSTSKTLTGLGKGSYTVKVKDSKSGCEQDGSYTITEPDSISADVTAANDSCLPGSDGKVGLIVRGGTPPYTYLWSNGATTAVIENLVAALYTVTVKDANNCEASYSGLVNDVNCDFNVIVHNVVTPNSDGLNDYFMIEGIQLYPKNVVQIYTKWGDMVYEKSNYDNKWAATRTNGEALPDGTYYYVVKLGEQNKAGGKNEFTGFIHIQR